MSMNVPNTIQYDFKAEGVDFLNSIRDSTREVSEDDWLEDIVQSLTNSERQKILEASITGDISYGAAYTLVGEALETEEDLFNSEMMDKGESF